MTMQELLAQALVWESEEFFRLITGSIHDAIFVTDLEGRLVFANKRAEAISGYRVEEFRGKELWCILVPETLAQAQARLDAVRAGETPSPILEGQIIRKDGSLAWVEVSASNIEQNGRVVGRLGVVRDVTDRKRADEALRESERRYRLLAENSTDVIWVRDLNLRLTYISPSVAKLRGYTAEEAMAQSPEESLTPASLEIVGRATVEELARERAGQADPFRSRTVELEVKRKDGSTVWTEVKISFMRDETGRPIGILGVGRDISERRRVEDNMRLQSAALEAAVNGILITDREGTIIWTNPGFTQLTGYDADEAVGRTPGILKSGRHDAPFYHDLWQTIRSGRAWHGEIVNRRKDGSLYHEEQTITPVRGRDGEITHFIAIKQDITARKRLTERLVQTEKLATLGELVGGIAHELNNPLAVMLGHAQMLRRTGQDPQVEARVAKIVDAANRAARIVRNFLTAVRRRPPEKTAVSINEIIQKTLDLLTYQARVGNIEIVTDLSPDVPLAAADQQQLQQVILNLANNALQAMSSAHGRGRLTVGCDPSPDRSKVTIRVSDDGPGIPPEHLPRIFEPLFTTKPPGEGTGLGLAIVQAIVTEHGGTLAVETECGRGTTFTVTLPIGTPVALEPAHLTLPAIPQGLRVLVADDETPVREMIVEALRGKGARVEAVSNGQEALDLLSRSTVDVLILDVRMPGMTGTQLWERIKSVSPDAACRTMFCTGSVVRETTRRFIEDTGCPTVSKPFEWSEFFAAVAEVLSRATQNGKPPHASATVTASV